MSAETIISLAELRKSDGENGPMYIAYDGIVYEVSASRRWRSGIHEGQHFPGQDLTDEMSDAPHGAEVFQKAYVRVVGALEELEE